MLQHVAACCSMLQHVAALMASSLPPCRFAQESPEGFLRWRIRSEALPVFQKVVAKEGSMSSKVIYIVLVGSRTNATNLRWQSSPISLGAWSSSSKWSCQAGSFFSKPQKKYNKINYGPKNSRRKQQSSSICHCLTH